MAKDPSKTEAPTPRRIKKTREEGQVPRSTELSKVINLLAGFVFMLFWVKYMGKRLMVLFQRFLSLPDFANPTPQEVYNLGLDVMAELAVILLPLLLAIAALVFITIRIQVGKLWTTKPFKFKWSKFNPIKGIKRMLFSMQTLIRLGRSVLQAFFIGLAPMFIVKSEMLSMLGLYHMEPQEIVVFILDLGARLVKYALIPMGIIAAADLWYTRWKYTDDLKMTKNEIKDERKMMEGDEAIKMRIRQKMMSMITKQMMKAVPKADVIITNPTHIAVALRYDATEAPAPIVLAKGAGRIAERIKEIAKEHKIPIKENVPLARALYKQAEIGDTIPPEFFKVVAVLLAQLWKNNPPKRDKPK